MKMKFLKTFESFELLNENRDGITKIEGLFLVEYDLLDDKPETINLDRAKQELEYFINAEQANVTIASIEEREPIGGYVEGFSYYIVELEGTPGELIKVAGTDKIVYHEW